MSAPIGGQAVLEGVMMRGPSNWAVAVRKPDGEIAQVAKSIASPMAKRRIYRLPVVRGVIALGESLAIGVFAFLGRPAWYWLIATRILLLPVIAGIAYELIRFAGKHSKNRILLTLLAPGLWLQRLTTREPTLDQIEVSIRALREVLDREGRLPASEAARVEVMA